MYACFAGYIVQAIVNKFVPLLFLTFEKTYQVPLSRITMLITFNFGIQLLIDLLAARFVDRIGYRVSIVLAHIFSAAGLIGLVILPNLYSSAFIGLLHSFYCWGHVGVVLISTIFFRVSGLASDNLKKGILAGVVFPVLLLTGIAILKKSKQDTA